MSKHLCDDRARWRPVRKPTFPSVCARTSSNSHPVTSAQGFPRTPFPGLRRGTRPRKLREQTLFGQVEVCTASVTRLPRTVLDSSSHGGPKAA